MRSPQAGPAERPFPVVGIGASAGGLEALDEFLKHLPPNPGMAFVVVQHLDPTRPGMMPELLQRATPMKVLQATDRLKLKPNQVYVIPPNKDLSLLRGSLFLFDPVEPTGRRLPIDFFFRALADERQDRAVGIVLSGMGSDGTQGLRAIKESGGLVLVQEPATARFDSMPRSALREGIADAVAPPSGLAMEVVRLTQAIRISKPAEPLLNDRDRSAFDRICILLREHTGHDFSLYKKSTVYRRIERRMGVHGLPTISAYVRFLRENRQESEFLFKELLIGVTSFFRDPDAWLQLGEEVLPPLLAAHPAGGSLRAWVAGCSTGEEAYSLAILFLETLQRLQPEVSPTLQIFATDLDPDTVAKARQGLFSARALAGLSPERLQTWFRPEGDSFRARSQVREMIVFAVQDLLQDPPFIRLDLLTCRNVLIYLSPELQQRLLPLFHYSLNPGGCLFLGSAESGGNAPDLFTPLRGKSKLFQRAASVPAKMASAFPLPPLVPRGTRREPQMPPPPINLQGLADQVLLQRFAPAAVLASAAGDILYVSGHTGKYLEPAMGKANWNIFAMARDGLRGELTLAFHRAQGQPEAVHLRGLQVGSNGGTQTVDVTVQSLEAPDSLRGMVMIVFRDQATAPVRKRRSTKPGATALDARIDELERELSLRLDELQAAREGMQASLEELKAANEELQSTNEELQSTNEELTTSKEELQSLNEELQTVNAEQQARVDELSLVNSDMRNLLDATDIATLFLDKHLNVRRFTTGTTRLFKLIPGDVGRPVTDIVHLLDYPALAEDAFQVLRTLAPVEREVASRQGDGWFAVRLLPYRTADDFIAGVVVSFQDISRAKALEAQLRAASQP